MWRRTFAPSKFLFDAHSRLVSGFRYRTRPTIGSLHWGSDLNSLGLENYILEYVVEKSTDRLVVVPDPILKSQLKRHSFSDRALVRLTGVTLDSLTGAIHLGEVFIQESVSLELETVLKYRKRPTCFFGIDEPAISIPFGGHYHWLLENLPRAIAALKFQGNAVFIAPTILTRLQRGALESLGAEVHYCNKVHKVDNLILATMARDCGWAHPGDIATLREQFNIKNNPGNSSLFISRVGARRSDFNTAKMDRLANDLGWRVIQAEDLSWIEGLEVFGDAKRIAGEHGGGLANIALAPRFVQVYEFYRRGFANPAYQILKEVIDNNSENYKSIEISSFSNLLEKVS